MQCFKAGKYLETLKVYWAEVGSLARDYFVYFL
jgi:hypothetical protein